MIKKATLILGVLAAVSALHASPTFYSLSFNFTDGVGTTLPTAGSFTYDSSLAVNPFSAFTVTEGGLVFDLTSAANSFTGNGSVGACKSAQSAAGLFNGMTAAGCLPGWQYAPDASFEISVCSLQEECDDGGASASLVSGGGGVFSRGDLTATAVPEPAALWLSGAGLLALMSRTRVLRRIARK
jgi:hypothetical protein